MDAKLLTRFRAACNVNRSDVAQELVKTIVEHCSDTITAKMAGDELEAVLVRAAEGTPQLIGDSGEPDDLAVVISVRDLAELVVSARQQETLGEALDAIGFKPYCGARILVGQGRKRERLQRSGDASNAATAN